MAAPQVAQGQVAQQLDRRLRVAAVQGRSIEVILIEQTDVAQEGELAILEQILPALLGIVVVLGVNQRGEPIVGGAEQQLGVDDPFGQELGVLVATAGFQVLGVGGELGLDHPLAEVGRLVGDLAEPCTQVPEDQANASQDDDRPAHQVLELVDNAPERFQERQGIDDQEEKEKRRPQPEQPLGGRARGVDERGAQAVEEDRRRERAVQVGEEVDDVQPALDQVAQIVGGQSTPLRPGSSRGRRPGCEPPAAGGRAADRAAGDSGRRLARTPVRCGRRAVRASSGSIARRPARRESRAREPRRPLRRCLGRQAIDPALQVAEDALGQLPALVAIEPSLDRVPRVLELAPQRHQAMAVARLGLLSLRRLEQHDVAIEQARHAAHQAIGEPQAG